MARYGPRHQGKGINKYLNNRKLNELTEDELEKLRNSIELKGE